MAIRRISQIQCSITECDRPFVAKGLCSMHWQRQKHGTNMTKPPRKRMESKVCTASGCGRKSRTANLCMAHYNRLWRGLDVDVDLVVSQPNTPDDLWQRVDITQNADECWEWLGHTGTGGYGSIRFQGTVWRTHRLAYYLHTGLAPSQDVLHSCDNPRCCNPNHLREGDDQDNTNDKVSRLRHRFGERHRCAKLTNAEVREIKIALRDKTATQKELSEQYHISGDIIAGINKGKIWKLITI